MNPDIAVRAPGRVNLIGEHTDYNDGFVLPVAIGLEIRIDVAPTSDGIADLTVVTTGERAQVDLTDIGPPHDDWADYLRGVAWALHGAGMPVGGFRGQLSSSLPQSAGLSSSAALELASAWALLAANSGGAQPPLIDRMELAVICQRAENEYVGVRSGLMDQFASSCGVAGNALLLDCRSREYRPVPIPAAAALMVIDTGTTRRLVGSEYNDRRAECQRGVAMLQARGEAVTSLRDVTAAMLERAHLELGDVTYRRCRHVVDENERTLAAARALESADFAALGGLFAASHASLRDLYEVSSPELDAAVDLARSTPGVIAARMTGAGFGGCTVNLVERGAESKLRRAVDERYQSLTGKRARVFEVAAVDGAGLIRTS